ncbi:MAG TPA: hypothetical protein VH088_05485 [Terriglobales bacterium]|jgi:hypothetical protein|nr:hypothetical protein [Terriglobales bacterium]
MRSKRGGVVLAITLMTAGVLMRNSAMSKTRNVNGGNMNDFAKEYLDLLAKYKVPNDDGVDVEGRP